MHLKNADWLDLTTEERAAAIAKVKLQFAPTDQTLVFAGSVEESKIVAATINKLKIGRKAGHVDGTTDKEIRDEIVSGFRPDGEYDTLSNRLVFTEGYDNAFIQSVIDAGRTQSDSLFEQKVGRGLRPWPGTVDGLGSIEERLQAIAESPKPVCNYFTMYDTSHLELNASIDLRVIDEDDVVQMPTCNPIIDVIIYEDPEEEQIPPRDWDDLDQIELFAVRKDVWTKTVFNEKLHILTDLRWILDTNNNNASLWIPKDPEGKTDTPVIWRLVETGTRKWKFQVVNVGGYSERVGRATAAYYEDYPKEITDFVGTLRKMDNHLKGLNRKQYELTKRDAYKEVDAIKRELDYLKRAKISHGPKLTRTTAHILMDSHRIKTSLTKLGLA
jgi:hypothetical protein